MAAEISSALLVSSRQLYHLTVQYGQACLLNDKDKASSYWQALIEGYASLDKLINTVHKLESEFKGHADILAELDET